MKKLVLFAAVVVAISFASCANKSAEAEAPVETEAVVEETPAVEEVVAADSTVEVVEEVVVETPAQ
ncbi:hypothetical protein [Viscerimonas tarda]